MGGLGGPSSIGDCRISIGMESLGGTVDPTACMVPVYPVELEFLQHDCSKSMIGLSNTEELELLVNPDA